MLSHNNNNNNNNNTNTNTNNNMWTLHESTSSPLRAAVVPQPLLA